MIIIYSEKMTHEEYLRLISFYLITGKLPPRKVTTSKTKNAEKFRIADLQGRI